MSTAQPIITVEGLSKVYRLASGRHGSYRTLRESIMEGLTRSCNKVRRSFDPLFRSSGISPNGYAGSSGHSDGFRALDDVSFEVEPGQVVGIVGRNGAGKSTLLKILSQITEPTGGQITLYGRVGSLLEVGTGFHLELTGRENIFLNGAILGMSRREIARKFDEIVDFAEIEKFLDMPVKRYSSGMYVRLAFAVAAHREPEIFIIDEVLAVGDIAFQKKCLGKISQVSRHGRTVLFVSHKDRRPGGRRPPGGRVGRHRGLPPRGSANLASPGIAGDHGFDRGPRSGHCQRRTSTHPEACRGLRHSPTGLRL